MSVSMMVPTVPVVAPKAGAVGNEFASPGCCRILGAGCNSVRNEIDLRTLRRVAVSTPGAINCSNQFRLLAMVPRILVGLTGWALLRGSGGPGDPPCTPLS